MTGEGATHPRARPDVQARAMADGSWLLIDPVAGISHAVNATAAYVWERCDGQHTVADLSKALQDAFSPPPEVVQGDVERLLQQFAALGLLAS